MNVQIIGDKMPPRHLRIRGDGAGCSSQSPLLYVSVPSTASTTVPCATSKLAINVVPRRIYSNSRRSLPRFHEPGGMFALQRLDAGHFVRRQYPLTNFYKAGACPYSVVRSAIFTSASASGSALSPWRLWCGLRSA